MTATDDYTTQVHLSASPERVFETLTTPAEFASWWAPATGSAAGGGELRLTFEGIEEPLVLRVKQASRPSTVIWDVESCAFLPDWVGTTIAFTLSEPDTVPARRPEPAARGLRHVPDRLGPVPPQPAGLHRQRHRSSLQPGSSRLTSINTVTAQADRATGP